jgi:hypothetical protein
MSDEVDVSQPFRRDESITWAGLKTERRAVLLTETVARNAKWIDRRKAAQPGSRSSQEPTAKTCWRDLRLGCFRRSAFADGGRVCQRSMVFSSYAFCNAERASAFGQRVPKRRRPG